MNKNKHDNKISEIGYDLLIDSNEAAVSAPDIAKKLRARFKVKIQHLDTGDYWFNNGICIERKTGMNFYQDILNRHLFEQLEGLCEVNEKPILLIEGLDYKKYPQIEPVVRGAIRVLLFSWKNLKLMFTKDEEDTRRFLYGVAKYAGPTGNKPPPMFIKKAYTPREMRIFMLQCIKGVGQKTSRRVWVQFQTWERLLSATIEELSSIPGITRTQVHRIYKALHG